MKNRTPTILQLPTWGTLFLNLVLDPAFMKWMILRFPGHSLSDYVIFTGWVGIPQARIEWFWYFTGWVGTFQAIHWVIMWFLLAGWEFLRPELNDFDISLAEWELSRPLSDLVIFTGWAGIPQARIEWFWYFTGWVGTFQAIEWFSDFYWLGGNSPGQRRRIFSSRFLSRSSFCLKKNLTCWHLVATAWRMDSWLLSGKCPTIYSASRTTTG